MGSIIGAIGTFIVLVLAAAFAVPHMVDWNDYRGVFEEQAGRLIGRKVAVEGDVKLAILPVPQFRFGKVRIAGNDGRFEPAFAEMRSIDMTLSLPALFSGVVEAKSVTLDKPVLHLVVGMDGLGNWRNIGTPDPTLLIVPRAVALNAVAITDGRIDVANRQTGSAWSVEGLNGEFAAESLSGPFKFTGAADFLGSGHEIRLATQRFEAGKLHLKASMRNKNSSAFYQFDGDLSGFDGPISYSGLAMMKTPLQLGGGQTRDIEAKAQALIAPEQVRFDGLSVIIADNGRTQTVSGSAAVNLVGDRRYQAELASEWFDAAAFDGAGSAYPFSALPVLFGKARAALPFLPENGRTTLAIARLALAGEELQGFSAELKEQNGKFRLASLKAAAPGDSDISLIGEIDTKGSGSFKGKAEVNGHNLGRFVRWAAQRQDRAGFAGAAQNFALKGDLSIGEGAIQLDNATGEFGGSTFTASFRREAGADGALTLTLDSDRLDLKSVVNEDFQLADLASASAPKIDAAAGQANKPDNGEMTLPGLFKSALAMKQCKLNLRLGQLSLPSEEVRDVSAQIESGGGVFNIARLQLGTSDGLRLNINGRLQSLERMPDGQIKLSLEGATPEAVKTLAAAFGGGSITEDRDVSFAAMAPFKAAGNIDARGSARVIDFKLDGLASDSPFSFAGRFEGDAAKFWDGSLDMEGWISNAKSSKLLTQILPATRSDFTKAAGDGQGLFSVSLKGPLSGSLDGKLSLTSPAASASFSGKLQAAKSPWEANGELLLKSIQPDISAVLLSAMPGGWTYTGPFSISAAFEKRGKVYALSNLNADLGGNAISGGAKIDMSSGKPAIAATLKAQEVVLSRLFDGLLEHSDRDVSAVIRQAGFIEDEGNWPDRPFAAGFFDGPSHSLSLKSGRLALGGGLVLQDATLEARLDRGKLMLSKLEGGLFDGNVSAQGSLKKDRGRYLLEGRASLDDARLDTVLHGPPGSKPLASGQVSLDLQVNAEGISPRGLMSVLSGKGKLTFGQGTFYNFAPDAPLRLVREQLESSKPAPTGELAKRLAVLMRQGDFAFKKLRAPFTIRNGNLNMKRASFRGGNVTLRAEMLVDLVSLKTDAELRLGLSNDWKAPKIPPVKLVFAGPLAEVATLQGKTDSSELEQFVAVRKMERDVERLEKLNQLGRLPPNEGEAKAAPAPEPGPRIDNRRSVTPPPPSRQSSPSADGVERKPLPDLPGNVSPKSNDAFGWKPSAEQQPLMEQRPAGEFERKMRSAIEKPSEQENSATVPAPAYPQASPGTGDAGAGNGSTQPQPPKQPRRQPPAQPDGGGVFNPFQR